MTVPFGFSVGDFVAAIELVGTVIDAVQASGQTSQRFRDLIRLLFSLETALIQVKDIQLHESMYAEHTALTRTALECQRTIDDFWAEARHYQPYLTGPSTSRARETWMKIKWALCKKDDIDQLKIDLLGHTQALNILMSAVKLKSEQIENQKRDTKQQTLLSLIQSISNQYMGPLKMIFTKMDGILEKVACAISMDFKIFAAVMDIQQILQKIPGQVLNQQPVYLVDALGFQRPFHLETITSLNLFFIVIRSNLDLAGIPRSGQPFVFTDTARRQDIDLRRPWEQCFRPGQKVEMSAVIMNHLSESMCPHCGEEASLCWNQRTECESCGVIISTTNEESNARVNRSRSHGKETSLEPIKFGRDDIGSLESQQSTTFRHYRVRLGGKRRGEEIQPIIESRISVKGEHPSGARCGRPRPALSACFYGDGSGGLGWICPHCDSASINSWEHDFICPY